MPATPSSHRQGPLISRMPYVGGLDGLRALAVSAVIVYHANHTWLPGGFLGVEVFFVISGYLITLLLVGEHERNGSISLRAFWRRRFRRLLPALWLTLVGVAVYMAVAWRSAQGRVRGDLVAGLTYTSNWFQIWVGQGYTAVEAFVPLRHLWSLAVEEQYYLVWPLVMVLVVKLGRDRIPRVGACLLVVSIGIAVAVAVLFVPGDIEATCPAGGGAGYTSVFGRCINTNESLYLGSLSRAGGLMLGGAMAMLWRPVAIMRGPLRRRARRLDLIAVLGAAGLGVLMWRLSLSEPGREFGIRYNSALFRGGFLLTGLATVTVIAAVTHQRTWAHRVMALAPLRWIGTRSYGLYLFHWPIFQVLRRDLPPELPVGRFAIGVALTCLVAEVSFRFVEMPVRQGRLGEWLRGERRPRTARARRRSRALIAGFGVLTLATSFAAISVGLAENRCIGGQECDNEAGQAVIQPSPSGTTPDTVAAPRVTSPQVTVPSPGSTPVAASRPTTTTTTSPPAPRPPLAIGESVMLGAAPNLTAGGIKVDAVTSRQGSGVAELLELIAPMGIIPSTVIIQTGTNGSVSAKTFARIMEQLPPAKVPRVFFLTVKAPRSWIEGNNALIRALPQTYPNVTVIDWERDAASIEAELSRSDGRIHLRTPTAKQFYANMIFRAVGLTDQVK